MLTNVQREWDPVVLAFFFPSSEARSIYVYFFNIAEHSNSWSTLFLGQEPIFLDVKFCGMVHGFFFF
jgi:hypothetical protein